MKNSNITRNIYSGCMIFIALMIVAGLFLYIIVGSETLSAIYVKNVYADNMGMLTCGVLLLGLYASKKKDGQNHSMFRMIFSLTTLFFMDLISSCIEGNASFIAGIIIVNTFVFIFEDIPYSYTINDFKEILLIRTLVAFTHSFFFFFFIYIPLF